MRRHGDGGNVNTPARILRFYDNQVNMPGFNISVNDLASRWNDAKGRANFFSALANDSAKLKVHRTTRANALNAALNANNYASRIEDIISAKPKLNGNPVDIDAITYSVPRRHAYGGPASGAWEGGDFATAGLDAGAGALSGAATGAAIGMVGGPIGAGVGALIGGGIGLIKGIMGGSAKAKARQQANEAVRQKTIENMNQRTDADTVEDANDNQHITTFNAMGGRIRRAQGGMIPLSHDTELAQGPSHEQGGIPYGPTDEIEGGETTMQRGSGTNIYSDRLRVPGTNMTYADASLPLMKHKGDLEKAFATNEGKISKERTIINDGKSPVLTINSAKRRAQISAMNSERILAEISQVNGALDNLFNTQEQQNGNNDGATQMAFGGRIVRHRGRRVPGIYTNQADNTTVDNPTYNVDDYGNEPMSGTPVEISNSLTEPVSIRRRGGRVLHWDGNVISPNDMALEYSGVNAMNPILDNTLDNRADMSGFLRPMTYSGRTINAGIDSMKTPTPRVAWQGNYNPTPITRDFSPELNNIKSDIQANKAMNSQLAFQAGADVLDTVSQSITNYQMSKLPVPGRTVVKAPRLNSYVDNSADINSIESQGKAAMKFLSDNVRNPQVRRNLMLNTTIQINKAKSTSFMNKLNAERQIENQNVNSMYRNNLMNADAMYQNAMDKYNATQVAYTRSSRIASDFADKIQNLGVTQAQLQNQDLSYGLMLSMYPEGVRKLIADQVAKGRSLRSAMRSTIGR